MARKFGRSQKLRGRALHFSLLMTAVLPAYLLYGYNQAVAGSLLTEKSWIKQFPLIYVNPKESASEQTYHSNIQGTVVAIYTAAGIFGSLFCIWSGDRFGRKKTIFIGACAAAIGAIIQCSSFSLAQLIVGRIIAGLGNGGIVATVPNLQAECSEPAKRGGVVQYLSVFALAGLAVAGWIDLGLSFTDPDSVAWRFPLAMPIFFSLLILIGLTFAPESPRWLVSAGRVEEAREVFSALYDVDPHDERINTEIDEVQAAANIDSVGFRGAFKMGENRLFHRFLICCACQTFQQLTGINCLAYYQDKVFQSLGLGQVDSGILAASVFTWASLASLTGVWTVDRFGRRPLMLISALGNGACMAIIAGASSNPNNKAGYGAATAFDFLFFGFFVIGFLGVTFLYAAEIAPLSLRVPITAVSTACVWAFNFMTVEVTPTGVQTIGYKFYIVWAVVNICLIFPSVYFFFPETKGLSLESIDRIFIESTNWFQPVWKAKKLLKQGSANVRNADLKDVEGVDHIERHSSNFEKDEHVEGAI